MILFDLQKKRTVKITLDASCALGMDAVMQLTCFLARMLLVNLLHAYNNTQQEK